MTSRPEDPDGIAGRARERRLPRLHLVTESRLLDEPGFVERSVERIVAGGAEMAFHLRVGADRPAATLHRLVRALLPETRSAGGILLVNGRVDVALAAGADGVQLGSGALPAVVARRLLGPERWIGVSVHGPESVRRAGRDGGADFLLLGTIHPSRSHPGRTGLGADGVRKAAESSRLPILAIGGVTPSKVPALLAAGAHGVAVLGGLWDVPDPAGTIREFRAALREGRARVAAIQEDE